MRSCSRFTKVYGHLIAFFCLSLWSQHGLAFQFNESRLTQIRVEYQPDRLLSYKQARDYLYTVVENRYHQLTGLYTGDVAPLDPNDSSPRQAASQIGFNTEHVYPRSKGAKIDGNSDLHHLFAVHRGPNSARGSLPFGQIDDNDHDSDWYCDGSPHRLVPDSGDACSQGTRLVFEPRADVRGIIARAMFYFYTMYRSAADHIDPSYFPSQVKLLCQWHRQFPVSFEEEERSFYVAEVQGNHNPFVIQPNLAEETYCAHL